MKHLHYSWMICIGCSLLLFCCAGLTFTGFSAYQPYLISLRGLSNFETSSISFIRSLISLGCMTLITPFMNRIGLRRVALIGLIACAGSFLVYGLTNSYIGCIAAAILAGCAHGFGGMIPSSILISRWFDEHKGLALGICMAATGLSSFIGSPIITAIVENYSLSTAFLGEAVFILLSAIVVYSILRSRPECLNIQPLGAGHAAENVSDEKSGYATQAVPKHLYIMMCIAILVFGFSGNNLYSHFSVLYKSVGMDSGQLSWMLSIFGISLAIGKCLYGQVSDKLGVFRSSAFMYVMVLVGTGICCTAGHTGIFMTVLAAVFMGFGLAVTSVSASTYALCLSTKETYPSVVSRFQFMSTLGGLLFATVPGLIADYIGSYVPAYILMFLLTLVSSISLLILYRTICKFN